MIIMNSYNNMFVDRVKSTNKGDTVGRTDNFVQSETFASILERRQENDFPYGSLAKDGIIEYNGVTFVGDPKTHTISLGDVSDPKKTLNISLPSGGNLKVNVNNLEDLSKAAGMFSPEDLNAILRAIEQYKHCSSKLKEIDDMENEIGEDPNDSNVESKSTIAGEVKTDKEEEV